MSLRLISDYVLLYVYTSRWIIFSLWIFQVLFWTILSLCIQYFKIFKKQVSHIKIKFATIPIKWLLSTSSSINKNNRKNKRVSIWWFLVINRQWRSQSFCFLYNRLTSHTINGTHTQAVIILASNKIWITARILMSIVISHRIKRKKKHNRKKHTASALAVVSSLSKWVSSPIEISINYIRKFNHQGHSYIRKFFFEKSPVISCTPFVFQYIFIQLIQNYSLIN